MKWLHRTLFRRLLTSYLITVVLGTGVMGIVITYSTTSYLSQNTEQEMLRQAKSINVAIQLNRSITPELERNLEFFDQSFDKRILVFNQYGRIILTSTMDKMVVGKEMEEPIAGVRSTVQNIREIVLWAMIFGIISSTFLVSYLSWTISRPLKQIEHTATEIALGNYSKRVEYDAQDEIGELAKSFDRMADKLDKVEKERMDREQKRDDFIANISHELRTPLTAMLGFTEALKEGLVNDKESRQRYYEVMYEELKESNLHSS